MYEVYIIKWVCIEEVCSFVVGGKDVEMLKKMKLDRMEFLFLLLLLFTCLQNIAIFDMGGFELKLYHAYSLIFLWLFIKERKILLPKIYLVIFIFYLIMMSVIAYFFYGFNSLILNYIYGFYILVIICTFGRDISSECWIKIVRIVVWIMLVLIYGNLFLSMETIISFMKAPWGHPGIDTFFGGGVNVEATWIGMMCVVFLKDKKKYIFLILSTIISILYASRAGLITNVMLFLIYYFKGDFKMSWEKMKKIIGVLLLSLAIIFTAYQMGFLDNVYVVRRFINMWTDRGTTTRIAMWELAISAGLDNIWGYGLGNATLGIELHSGIEQSANNTHNLFLQYLLDGGIIALVGYIAMLIILLKEICKNSLTNPFLAFMAMYVVLGVIQFRGGDSIMFFFLGVYLLLNEDTPMEIIDLNKYFSKVKKVK